MQDPYSILGVSRDASDEDIKKAYRKLSRIYHPDANINNPNKDQAEAKFKEIQQAMAMPEAYTEVLAVLVHSAVSTVSIPIRISRQPRQKKIFICVPPPII